MFSVATWLLAAAILLGPPLSVVGLVVWARRLSKRGAPRVAVVVAYALAAIVVAAIVGLRDRRRLRGRRRHGHAPDRR